MPRNKRYIIDITALQEFLRFASIFVLLLSLSMSPIVMTTLPSILSISPTDNRMLAFAQQSATEQMPQQQQQQQQSPSDKIISNSGKIAELAKFNPQAQELPEGLALQGRYAYVSLSPLIQVLRIQLPTIPLPLSAISPLNNNNNNSETISGQSQNLTYSTAIPSMNVTRYGTWPQIPAGKGSMLGLSIDDKGNLFAAIASQTDKVKTGVYRLGPSGIGNATLVASSPEMKLPNDIVFGNTTGVSVNQQQNNSNAISSNSSKNSSLAMYVSDPGSGTIFRVLANGTAEKWASSPLLQGNKTFCPGAPQLGMDIGANGMAFNANGSSVFVTNTDKASIIRIPISANGSAGNPEVFVGPDCEKLAGADGMVMNLRDNSLYVAVNKLNSIAKVSLDDNNRNITIFASTGALDFPASLELGTSPFSTAMDSNVANSTELYITNFAMISAQKNQTSANPGLLKSDIFER